MMLLERQYHMDDPRSVSRLPNLARQYHTDDPRSMPPPSRLERCDYEGVCEKVSQLLSPVEFETYIDLCRTPNNWTREKIAPLMFHSFAAEALDYSWWEQDEEDWDVYNQTVPVDAYDHLTEEELDAYLLDRGMKL
jgi:hypothetical protein